MTSPELFNTEPELAVLSILFNNPELIHSTNGLSVNMFSASPHQIIYSEMKDLASRNIIPDFFMVTSSLEAAKRLDSAGGKDYLSYLSKESFPKENINEYLKFMIESFRARSLVSLTSSIKVENLSVDNVGSEIQRIKNGLDTMSSISTNNSIAHIGDLVDPFYDGLIERTKNPGIRGTSWGIKKIDGVTGGKSAGELWFIAARPSVGKTALICNTLLADGINNVPSLLLSREMSYRELLERIVPIYTGIPITNLRMGILDQKQLDTITDALKKIKQMPIYLDTNAEGVDEFYIENIVRKYHSLHGIQNFYLDYIQLMVERDDNATHALGRISRTMKRLSISLGICSVALSQLNREVEHRENKRPIMSDMRQSGNLEEDTDCMVGLYRDIVYNKQTKDKDGMEFIILKARNGPTGVLPLKFIDTTNKIYGED